MRKISWWGFFPLALAILASGPAHAQTGLKFGDEDPIPWACVDFSGSWKSDAGGQIQIEQRKCSWLKVKGNNGLQDNAVVIVPDDKIRTFADDSYRGAVRYRWNSREYGSVLETSRVICYSNRTIEEYVTLEQVSENLLLETTYRSTTMLRGDGKPRRDVKQQQLRRKPD
jgi:hypothetical protein